MSSTRTAVAEQFRLIGMTVLGIRSVPGPACTLASGAVLLLKENLSPAQRLQYQRSGYFDVVGGDTGNRYRIWHGSQMNVERLGNTALRLKFCFMPKGQLPIGDVMLAQKIALELFESKAVAIANKTLADFPSWFGEIG